MVLNKTFLFMMVFFLSACGFHLKTNQLSFNFSEVEPKFERERFIQLGGSLGIQNSPSASIIIYDYKIEPKPISDKNTGNKWRQYQYNASWKVKYTEKIETISASEEINIPSNQSPYQTQIISNQLDSLRIQLMKHTVTHIETFNQ